MATSIMSRRRESRRIKTQPYRILVAASGEPSSAGAIRLAALLGRRRSASVHALIVATPFPHALESMFALTPPSFIEDENRRTALQMLRQQLAPVRTARQWTMRVTSGYAPGSILEAAARWPASLVVIGTGEHTALDRLVGSETAVQVVSHAIVPVLAVPEHTRTLPVRAVAAVDFSQSSINAAKLAASLLGPRGTLTLLYASPLIVTDAVPGTLTDLYTSGAVERLARVAEEVRRHAKRPVESTVASGGIVDCLLRHAETNQCDLIALGAHEPSLLERLLVGKVRTQVMRAAPCAILVAPPVSANG